MPSDAIFPILRVAEWDGQVSLGMTTQAGRQLFDKSTRTPIGPTTFDPPTSCTLMHQRGPPVNDEFIEVTSSLPEPEDEIDWHYLVSNMLIRVMRDEARPEVRAAWGTGVPGDAWAERIGTVLTDIDEGRIPILPAVIRVDGAEVEVPVLSLGRCFGGGAMLDDVTIQMWSSQVPFNGLSLVTDRDFEDT